jgi:Ssp1 endopeptidase immunity protein Rap1a
MRIPALMVAVLVLAGPVGSANPLQTQTSPFREPRSVSDVLDACGEAVSELDNPPTQAKATDLLKFGWCLGWAQGFFERIIEVHLQARVEEMIAKKVGKPTPPPQVADKSYMSICLPNDTRTQDVIRVIVTGLQRLPMQLQEPKNGPVKDVLRKAYPCPASTLEDAKPPDAKP